MIPKIPIPTGNKTVKLEPIVSVIGDSIADVTTAAPSTKIPPFNLIFIDKLFEYPP